MSREEFTLTAFKIAEAAEATDKKQPFSKGSAGRA
jgi:hypothetical protein